MNRRAHSPQRMAAISARRWSRAAVMLGLAACASVKAAEAPVPGNATPPVKKSATAGSSAGAPVAAGINAAKKDFETLKATRDPARQQKSGLPGIAMPELPNSAADLRVDGSSAKARKAEATTKKQANWLVDAMDKSARKSGGSERRQRDADLVDERSDGELEADPLSDSKQDRLMRGERDGAVHKRSGNTADRDDATSREKATVTNPLTKYLGEWMTPRDFAMLRPGLDESVLGRAGLEIDPGTPGAATLPGSLGIAGGSEIFGANRQTPISPPATRENPYLASMQSMPLGRTGDEHRSFSPAPAPIGAPAPAPANVGPSVAPVEVPKPRIPDFAKPAQDEKYFKQLKRF